MPIKHFFPRESVKRPKGIVLIRRPAETFKYRCHFAKELKQLPIIQSATGNSKQQNSSTLFSICQSINNNSSIIIGLFTISRSSKLGEYFITTKASFMNTSTNEQNSIQYFKLL